MTDTDDRLELGGRFYGVAVTSPDGGLRFNLTSLGSSVGGFHMDQEEAIQLRDWINQHITDNTAEEGEEGAQ